MDLRPRPCCNIISVIAPFVGYACGLLAGSLYGGPALSVAKAVLVTLFVFLVLGFVSGCFALFRSERLWGITVLGLVLNAPVVIICVMAPWDWPG